MHAILPALCAFLLLAAAKPGPACRDAADCNVAGTHALRAGRLDAAQTAFEREANFAWCGDRETPAVVLARNNLAVLALRRGRPLEARLWADLALKEDPGSGAARHNARLAAERVARLPPGAGVTGTYWCRWAGAVGHEMIVQELPGKRIRFEVQAIHLVPSRACDPPEYRMGGAMGIVDLKGRVAVWRTEELGGECVLRFTFGPDEVTVEQDGLPQQCGFGGDVGADGRYRRTSRGTPRFPMWGTQ